MTVISIGEAMVEFAPAANGLWRQGFAGDTLNVAWTLKARLRPEETVRYITRVGRDGFSRRFRAFLDEAGIDTAAVLDDAQRSIGLYTIETDANGERSFAYWRGQSAARGLVVDPSALAGARLVYFSGISLAVLEGDGRAALLDAVRACGAQVAFDPNIRPRLWESPDAARHWIRAAAAMADVVLPTHDDERALFGDLDSKTTRARYRAMGVAEVVVKDGTNPTLLAVEGREVVVPVPAPVRPVDTTGAGDAFNGAYLAARLSGSMPEAAVAGGQAVSRLVVSRSGALVAMHELAAEHPLAGH